MTKTQKAALNNLVLAGSQMSNLTYNLKQVNGKLSDSHKEQMSRAVTKWDNALMVLRLESRAKTGGKDKP